MFILLFKKKVYVLQEGSLFSWRTNKSKIYILTKPKLYLLKNIYLLTIL